MKQNTSRSIRQSLQPHTNNHVDSSIVLSDLEFSGDGVGYVTPINPPTNFTAHPLPSNNPVGVRWWGPFIYVHPCPSGEDICIYTLLGRSLQYCANENATPDLHLGKENTSHQNPKFFLLNKHIELTQYTICGIVLSFQPFKNWGQQFSSL